MLGGEARAEAEALGRQMGGRADAGGGEVELAGIGLGEGDQFAQRLPAFRRCRDQHGRLDAERNDRDEIVEGVVGQALVERIAGAEGRGMHQDGVAVRRRLGDEADAGGPARARAVLDHDRLADLLGELVEDDAPDHVVGVAGRKRNHRLDGARRPGLRRRGVGRCRQKRGAHRSQPARVPMARRSGRFCGQCCRHPILPALLDHESSWSASFAATAECSMPLPADCASPLTA